jgi:hypothetical protein
MSQNNRNNRNSRNNRKKQNGQQNQHNENKDQKDKKVPMKYQIRNLKEAETVELKYTKQHYAFMRMAPMNNFSIL